VTVNLISYSFVVFVGGRLNIAFVVTSAELSFGNALLLRLLTRWVSLMAFYTRKQTNIVLV